MAWTAPRTWIAGELVTASLLNTHLRDNLNALKAPPTTQVAATGTRTTTSGGFVEVDATAFNLSLTTTGGDVLLVLSAAVLSSAAARVNFDVEVDGTRLSDPSTQGAMYLNIAAGQLGSVNLVRLVTGLAAGAHTFDLIWKTNAGTISLIGRSNQFWVREV